MIHEISLPFVIRQAKNRRHAYYTMVEMATNWLNKKRDVTKLSNLDTGHPIKTKSWQLSLTQDDTWYFLPLCHPPSKTLTLPIIKTVTIVTKIKSRTFGFNFNTQQRDKPDRSSTWLLWCIVICFRQSQLQELKTNVLDLSTNSKQSAQKKFYYCNWFILTPFKRWRTSVNKKIVHPKSSLRFPPLWQWPRQKNGHQKWVLAKILPNQWEGPPLVWKQELTHLTQLTQGLCHI